MSELPPYTGTSSEPDKKPAAKKPVAKKPDAAKTPATKPAAKTPAKKPAAKTPPPPVGVPTDTVPPEAVAPAAAPAAAVPAGYAPVVPGPPAPWSVVWHSRVVLIGTAAAAVLAAILTVVGSNGFPSAAPVEQLYAFGLIVDLVAVAVVIGALLIVEFVRRGNSARLAAPLNTRPSVFAIVGVILSVLTLVTWATTGGVEQLGYVLQGIRGRYMYWTGSLVFAGIPWALGAIFGAWGFRPRAHLVTNVLALAAVLIWFLLAALTTAAALIYGAGLSD